ncbi:BPI fold-containing family B member 6-like [Leptodactylus fuscus]
MAMLVFAGVFLGLVALCQSLEPRAYLQMDSCAMQNAVTDILTDKNTLKKMSDSPAAKKALGSKGKSPVKGITNIKVDKIEFSKISLNILPDGNIQMFVTNKIEISGKSFLGGKTYMKMEVDIITNSSLKKEGVDCPTFVKTECKTNVVDIKANLPKGILPNVMNNFLDKNLKSMLPTTVCPAVDYVLSELNKKLCLKDISLPIGQSGSLHYMTSPVPTVSEGYIDIEIKESSWFSPSLAFHITVPTIKQKNGNLKNYVKVLKGENPIERTEDEDTSSDDLPPTPEATTLLLTTDFLGRAFTVFQEEGSFNFMATEDDLVNGGAMSTSTLSDIIPELSPDLQDFKVNVSVKKSALVTATDVKVILHLYSMMDVIASSPDSESQTLFEVNLHMNFMLQITPDEKSLKFTLSLDKMFLALESSTVGEFEVEDLNEFITSMINTLYIPAVNGIIQPIPIPQILQNLDINLANAQVESDKMNNLQPVALQLLHTPECQRESESCSQLESESCSQLESESCSQRESESCSQLESESCSQRESESCSQLESESCSHQESESCSQRESESCSQWESESCSQQ